MPDGSDRVQPAQLNAYRRSAFRPDNYKEYQPFLRDLSWCATPANVPAHAQASQASRAAKEYTYQHPTWRNNLNTSISYTSHGNPFTNRHTILYPSLDSRSSTRARGTFPTLSVSERLQSTYRGPGSMSTTRLISSASSLGSPAKSDMEAEGDGYFKVGKFSGALGKYDAALSVRPNDTALLAKRCAVLCHLGQYQRGLTDAHNICSYDGSAKALNRSKAIARYIKNADDGSTGFETAHITLLHLITPEGFKQW